MIQDLLKEWGLDDVDESARVMALAAMVNELERSRGGKLVFDILQFAYDGAIQVLHTCDLKDSVRLQEAIVRARASKEILDTLTGYLRARDALMKERAEAEEARKAAKETRADGRIHDGDREDLGVEKMGIETRTQNEGGEIA